MSWIGVDLDGTLAHYGSWQGIEHIGEPVLPMLSLVQRWIDEGRTVKIFTARIAHEETREQSITEIQNWCEKHGLPRLEVTNVKDFGMIALYDDRAYRVEMNTGRIIGHVE